MSIRRVSASLLRRNAVGFLLRPSAALCDPRYRTFASGSSSNKGALYFFNYSSYSLCLLPITIYLNTAAIDLIYPIIVGYHMQHGMEHIAEDYFKNLKFLVYGFSAVTFIGLGNLCINGKGISPVLNSWFLGNPLEKKA